MLPPRAESSSDVCVAGMFRIDDTVVDPVERRASHASHTSPIARGGSSDETFCALFNEVESVYPSVLQEVCEYLNDNLSHPCLSSWFQNHAVDASGENDRATVVGKKRRHDESSLRNDLSNPDHLRMEVQNRAECGRATAFSPDTVMHDGSSAVEQRPRHSFQHPSQHQPTHAVTRTTCAMLNEDLMQRMAFIMMDAPIYMGLIRPRSLLLADDEKDVDMKTMLWSKERSLTHLSLTFAHSNITDDLEVMILLRRKYWRLQTLRTDRELVVRRIYWARLRILQSVVSDAYLNFKTLLVFAMECERRSWQWAYSTESYMFGCAQVVNAEMGMEENVLKGACSLYLSSSSSR